MATKGLTGWWNPRPFSPVAKFHYLDGNGRSLCCKWAGFGLTEDDVEEGDDDHKDNCAVCRKRKLALTSDSKPDTLLP